MIFNISMDGAVKKSAAFPGVGQAVSERRVTVIPLFLKCLLMGEFRNFPAFGSASGFGRIA